MNCTPQQDLPSPWPDHEHDEIASVRLVRHGQTSSYESDSGLTELGRTQAFDKGIALAAELAGWPVWLPHAPTARATETAQGLHEGLLQGLAGDPAAAVRVMSPYADPLFDNFRLACDGEALDPTQAFGRYRAHREQTPTDQLPGWFAEMDRFVSLMSSGADPITYWLTQPLQHFEPSSSTVRRFWDGIRLALTSAPAGVRLVVSTHSGCIRAVAAAALGYDPGEPHNTEEVAIRVAPTAARAVLYYRGQAVELAVPSDEIPFVWQHHPAATTTAHTTSQG